MRKRQSGGRRSKPDQSVIRAAADELGLTTPKSAERRPRRKGPMKVRVIDGDASTSATSSLSLSDTLKQELLRSAAELVDREELAVRLNAPVHLLGAWINGQATMPDWKIILLASVLDQFSTRP